MAHRSIILLLAAPCLLVAPLAGQGLERGFHVDRTLGYKIRVPSKWSGMAIDIDEKWIKAHYLCNRSYQPKGGDAWTDHKPYMRVIVFTDEARKVRGPSVTNRGDDTRVITGGTVPYQDYRDYLKRNQGAGFYFSKEDEGKIAGKPVSKFEIKLEKQAGVPRRLITWVYHADDADYAVEFEVLEDHYRKIAPTCYGALKSFRFIEREAAISSGVTGDGSGAATRTPPWELDRDSWRKLSAAERTRKRKAIEESRMARTREHVPAGWKISETRHFLVISNADPRFTKKIVDAAQTCRSWLEKNLDDINDEYVMRGIIRVFASRDEYNAYVTRSGDTYNPHDREIPVCKDTGFGARAEYEGLFGYLFSQFIHDKEPLLSYNMPPWLSAGLVGYIGSAQPKGNRLVFDSSEWENTTIREAEREGKLRTARELIRMTSTEFYGSFTQNTYQAVRLMRQLMGPLSRKKPYKGLVLECMAAVVEKAEEMESREPTVRKDAETEEEEERRFKERQEAGKKNAEEFIKALEAKVFDWSDKEWQTLERAYAAALK
jgi:hypothetical protein